MNVLGKDYDTERRFVRGKWISRPLRCVEISIDSQLGRIPSVVSAPISHRHPLTLSSLPPTTLLLLPSSFRGSKFFLLLFSFCFLISRNAFLHNGALI